MPSHAIFNDIENIPGVVAQVQALQAGRTTIAQIVDALLDRIAAVETDVRAWEFLDADQIRLSAKELDRKLAGGLIRPLHGLVFAAKDNFDSHDMPTSYGSIIHKDFQPNRDASAIATLRGQGALLLGKTVTTEFAHVTPGATRNPHDVMHTPGGSSSGSAAAVASGMVPLAFGSQTTGSVIRPAAYCGVVGFKPTHGLINVSGMLANCPSFDTVGIMTRSIGDVALVFRRLLDLDEDATMGSDQDANLAKLRVGVLTTPCMQQADAEQTQLVERAAGVVADAGAQVSEFDDLGAFDNLIALNRIVAGFEFARTLADERFRASQQLSDALTEGRLRDGLTHSYNDYVDAIGAIEAARLQLDRAFDRFDIVLSPPAHGAAPLGLESTGSAVFNLPWTTLHAPTITLPLAASARGLPLGLQIASRRRRDMTLLHHARTVEACFNQRAA